MSCYMCAWIITNTTCKGGGSGHQSLPNCQIATSSSTNHNLPTQSLPKFTKLYQNGGGGHQSLPNPHFPHHIFLIHIIQQKIYKIKT